VFPNQLVFLQIYSDELRPSGFHIFGFHNNNFLQSKVFSFASNPNMEGAGYCIYDPSDKGGPVIPLKNQVLFSASTIGRATMEFSNLPHGTKLYKCIHKMYCIQR
jgi:hypothetical protein